MGQTSVPLRSRASKSDVLNSEALKPEAWKSEAANSRRCRKLSSPALWLGLLVALATIAITQPLTAKTPGGVHCYRDVCRRVLTIDETVMLVGKTQLLKASIYDDPAKDSGNTGKYTSNGEQFDAASPARVASANLPDGTLLLLRNPRNGRASQVRVNDYGPFHSNRMIDVTRRVGHDLGIVAQGVAKLEVTVLAAPTEEQAEYRRGRKSDSALGYLGVIARENTTQVIATMIAPLATQEVASAQQALSTATPQDAIHPGISSDEFGNSQLNAVLATSIAEPHQSHPSSLVRSIAFTADDRMGPAQGVTPTIDSAYSQSPQHTPNTPATNKGIATVVAENTIKTPGYMSSGSRSLAARTGFGARITPTQDAKDPLWLQGQEKLRVPDKAPTAEKSPTTASPASTSVARKPSNARSKAEPEFGAVERVAFTTTTGAPLTASFALPSPSTGPRHASETGLFNRIPGGIIAQNVVLHLQQVALFSGRKATTAAVTREGLFVMMAALSLGLLGIIRSIDGALVSKQRRRNSGQLSDVSERRMNSSEQASGHAKTLSPPAIMARLPAPDIVPIPLKPVLGPSTEQQTGSISAVVDLFPEAATWIGPDLLIEGNVSTSSAIRIAGRIDGTVSASTIIIEETGVICGELHADVVTVFGYVAGTITARSFQAASTATIEGNIVSEFITMDAGAEVDGWISHKVIPPQLEAPNTTGLELADQSSHHQPSAAA